VKRPRINFGHERFEEHPGNAPIEEASMALAAGQSLSEDSGAAQPIVAAFGLAVGATLVAPPAAAAALAMHVTALLPAMSAVSPSIRPSA
jgi:hypothetical protein